MGFHPYLRELLALGGYLRQRRRRQLFILLLLMNASAFAELLGLGALLPFLTALSTPQDLLGNNRLQWLWVGLGITQTEPLLLFSSFFFMMIVAVATIVRLLAQRYQWRLAYAIAGDLSCELYRRTLLQPYSFHIQYNSSNLIADINANVQSFINSTLSPLFNILSSLVLSAGLALGILVINPFVALITALGLTFAYGIAYQITRKQLVRISAVIVEAQQHRVQALQEGLGGIRDVLLDGSQGVFEDIYFKYDRQLRQAQEKSLFISVAPRFVVEGAALCVVAAVSLLLTGGKGMQAAIPILGTMALAANKIIPAAQMCFASLAAMKSSRVAMQRVLQGLQRPVLVYPQVVEPLLLREKLDLQNIWYCYPGSQTPALQGLSLTIPARTTVGLVGASGCGKSTTADILLVLLEPQQGHLLVDGVPIQGEMRHRWQRNIAHVPQSIFLSDATIAENIAFGVPSGMIDHQRVREAAKMAQLAEFIEGRPLGYDEFVGERGVRLSGGQRQRIGIARALYKRAEVIVFDEATSALDQATENEVMAAISGLSGSLTLILIAHRLSTLRGCDRIFELAQGRVIRQGDPAMLGINLTL